MKSNLIPDQKIVDEVLVPLIRLEGPMNNGLFLEFKLNFILNFQCGNTDKQTQNDTGKEALAGCKADRGEGMRALKRTYRTQLMSTAT